MREEFLKNVINGFSKFYDYGVIELNSFVNLASNWALVKNLNPNSKRVIIFLDNAKAIDNNNMLYELKRILNCESIELVKIIALENKAIRDIEEFIYQEDIITADYTNNRLLSYGYMCENTAQQLANIINYYSNRKAESSQDKPWITYVLILINVMMYIITALLSGDPFESNINVLVFLGAKYNELIALGQYYRLITCIFLHGGILHLALNMYSLNSIGPLVERIYGKLKYLLIYFISGVVSSLLSYFFSEGISIGASGAIFGLLGTTLVFAITMRKDIGKGFLRNISSVIIISLFIGFTLPNIDNFGHIGGLIGGVVAAFICNWLSKK